ncbi:hypothetical protein AL755_07185 [Arthrobacter sp. ERGS1:01]|uniref:hypothetical protein n=1 Tax=Arthrobacter sp. ERGS1:01 TaxID=1704044 RepID=UPI0006B4532C|nr:hypothetical protein [Arthrobacter sp. ERGS1:01]ALE05303.1 hypothetical protein AL755_07185 [Arthrobacter sp. ERGS1:01]
MDLQKIGVRVAQLWPSGVVIATTAQLDDAGCGDRLLKAAVDMRVLVRIRRGAYVRTEVWDALKPWEQSSFLLMAHILTASGNPVYSHFSAARLHGLDVWNCGDEVHVTSAATPSGMGVAADVVHHHLPLPQGSCGRITSAAGPRVRVTSLERTVVDCARYGGFAQAVAIGDHALRRGANLEVMTDMVSRLTGQRGVKRARRVLAALNDASESVGESRTRLVLVVMDIPEPVLQLRIVANGTEYRADFAWPELKLILEFDGQGKYFDFRPTAEALLAERRRETLLMEQGWRFIRVVWDDLARPEALRQRIYRAISDARRAAA